MNLIFGASGFAGEVEWLAHEITECGLGEFAVDFFVDQDRGKLVGSTVNGKPVLSESEAFERFVDTPVNCFIAVGSPALKRALHSKIAATLRRASFPNLIHPKATYDRRGVKSRFGSGLILYPNVVVSCNVILGDFVTVNINGIVGHDAKVGSYTQLAPGVSLGGWAVLGEEVAVGMNASILPKALVEDGAVVGAGSVVLRRVGGRQTVFGVPAKTVPLPKPA